MSNEKLESILSQATQLVGPDIAGNLPLPLYNFMRRYGPMLCVDVALVPEGDKPSVLLVKRTYNAVAPGEYFIVGGRVDKRMEIVAIATEKIQKEIGIKANVNIDDLIGIGFPRFLPNHKETTLRDYEVYTPALCYAYQIPQADLDTSKLKAGDGNTDWKVFTEIDPLWNLYVVHAIASAWDRFFGKKWRESVDIEVKKKLDDRSAFIPLKHVSS